VLVSWLHSTNLIVHIGVGAVAMLVGFAVLARAKGTAWHRRAGRTYARFAIVVSVTGGIGVLAFRFLPLFATLSVLTGYQLASGWRDARRKADGPTAADAAGTLLAAGLAVAILPTLNDGPLAGSSRPMVVYSTLGALGLLLTYDLARFSFPRAWHARLWVYSHVYKSVFSLFGMVSALVGNVVRFGQPWSQLLPSVVGTLVLVWFIVRIARGKQDGSMSAADRASA
jgi:uncharacterized membrane protein